MSNIKIVNDAYGRPHPVKEEQLFEYGIKPDGSTLGTVAGGGSIFPVQVVSGTITSEQLLNIGDTPVVLVPAPGAGKANVLVHFATRANLNTTPYDDFINLYYTAPPGGSYIAKYFAEPNHNSTTWESTIGYYFYENASYDMENKDIIATTPTAVNLTGGDGTVDYIIYYVTYDFSGF